MATTYDYVAANKRRSVLLIAVFVAVIIAVGWVFAQLLDYGLPGLVVAVGFASLWSLIGYYNGDKIALFTAGAQGPITKEQNAYVFNMVENLSIADGLPMPKIFLMNDPQINAFATGRGPKNASLAITTGAIEQLENEELEGVLAHELSHIKNLDVRYMTLVAILVGILTLLANYFWRASMFGGRRRDNNSGGGQIQAVFMIVGLILLVIAPILGRLIQLAVSRKREFLADASGALLTRYPEGLARALEKIAATAAPLDHANQATAHLYISNPFGPQAKGMSKLFSTHPPMADRVAALRSMSH